MGAAQLNEGLNLQHTDCVVEAAKAVFGTACGIQIEPSQADSDAHTDGVIFAVISLVGDVEWSVFLGLPRGTATATAARFAGFDIPFDSDDMGDAVGELTNILAGHVKALLDKRGLRAEISLPSVVRAENLAVLNRRDLQVAKTCFNSELGNLWAGVTFGTRRGFAS